MLGRGVKFDRTFNVDDWMPFLVFVAMVTIIGGLIGLVDGIPFP